MVWEWQRAGSMAQLMQMPFLHVRQNPCSAFFEKPHTAAGFTI